ncbi:pyroglutamyl-peptidase I [Vibrio sp. Of7-15]|uniref:pyroglutamyl-peptidase I n=1 Tax=Vibrio sp. Of7-15 TaxID=2724879 RepID=UPI001EF275D1|nr:pyroglutamyl-peptidase I [Vibrio sp. Of7-15]MCG7499652.1 pyroglutamyl-peptidase I [Vibrio sp. Of7-15]
MKTVLMTGFEPFGNDTINPSLEAVKQLDGCLLDGGIIVTCQVPVVHDKAIATVASTIEKYQPDHVITIGQAAGRDAITPERVAINIDDYRIEDNEGNQPIDSAIIPNGPTAYFSTLPIKAIVHRLTEHGIAAQISNSAGTFVCNHLFYGIQHYLRSSTITHGFIHIPLIPEQTTNTNHPSMDLETIIKGLKVAAQAVVHHKQDIVSKSTTSPTC